MRDKPEKQQQAVHLQTVPLHVDACPTIWQEHQIHNPSHTEDKQKPTYQDIATNKHKNTFQP